MMTMVVMGMMNLTVVPMVTVMKMVCSVGMPFTQTALCMVFTWC